MIMTIVDRRARDDARAGRGARRRCRVWPRPKTPLADAAVIFMGAGGALLMTVGTMISVAGNNVGRGAVRIAQPVRAGGAGRRAGDSSATFIAAFRRRTSPSSPRVCARWSLALTGGFAELAAISAIARLLVYAGTCASVLALRRQSRAPFTIPFGPVVPVLALLVCAAILASATTEQVWRSAAALARWRGLVRLGRSRQ